MSEWAEERKTEIYVSLGEENFSNYGQDCVFVSGWSDPVVIALVAGSLVILEMMV